MSVTDLRPLEWHGARLRLARTAWLSLAGLAFAVLLVSIPAYIGSVGTFTCR
jgi:hypothetical protein